ncbi:hypothetical protein KC365_g5408 [Hortaea werneckii]|nr:hypothetical protein KC339_g10682 [Hortaea werneckii]KAI7235843.1 hypothetical protein KC365_g5408 [Hortaea werneckii]
MSSSLLPRTLSRVLPRPQHPVQRTSSICASCRRYASAPSSTSLPAPPLLLKLRKDLKTAMQQKDTPRLNVLRALLAELLSVLRKRAAAAKAARAEFEKAGRQDLVDREDGQASIIDEYAGGVETMSVEDVKVAVEKTIAEAKEAAQGKAVQMGEVMKKILGPGGALEGKPVEKSEVARLVKDILGTK